VNILVTGGAGFIGSHLCGRLAALGHRVTVLDDLSRGCQENLEPASGAGEVVLVSADVRDKGRVADLVAGADMVYHLAAWDRARTDADLAGAVQVNIGGLCVVLQAATPGAVPVIVTSSSDVYGRQAGQPLCEDAACQLGPASDPYWAYACQWLLAESLCLASADQGTPVTILRLFDVYGPRDRSGLTARLLAMQGNGPHTLPHRDLLARSLMYVSDAVNALVLAAQVSAAVGQVFNIGWNRPASPRYVRPDRSNLWVADTTRSRRWLGFVPRVRLDQGLRLTRSRRAEAAS